MTGNVVRTPASRAVSKSKANDKSKSKIGRPRSGSLTLSKRSIESEDNINNEVLSDDDLPVGSDLEPEVLDTATDDGNVKKAVSTDTLTMVANGQGNSESSTQIAMVQGGLLQQSIPLTGQAAQLPEGATNFNWRMVPGPEGQLTLVPFSIAMPSDGPAPPLLGALKAHSGGSQPR
ncbi:hypothetical protein Pmar_PMAR002508, partial [Perkinsus marinus ATCC 50983]